MEDNKIVFTDENGEEIDVHVPTNTLKWELLSDPSEATLVVDKDNRNAVVVPEGNNGFSVKAEWKISESFKFIDIYDSAIVGEQEESEDIPGTLDDLNGDGISDRYQVTVKYVASDVKAGSISISEELITITDEDGEYARDGKVKISGATATVNEGYKFDGWYDEGGIKVGSSESFTDYEFNAEGLKTYTFTASIPENLDDNNSDGIPDKYQATVKYIINDIEN